MPFWRVTFPSNVSPGNVPDSRDQFSILCEVNQQPHDIVDANLQSRVYHAVRDIGLAPKNAALLSSWECVIGHGYPVPTLNREAGLVLCKRICATQTSCAEAGSVVGVTRYPTKITHSCKAPKLWITWFLALAKLPIRILRVRNFGPLPDQNFTRARYRPLLTVAEL